MSSTNPSDPRLLLPEWLRDGDPPASTHGGANAPRAVITTRRHRAAMANVVTLRNRSPRVSRSSRRSPFSERLSLDTRLDPDQLVSAADLPKWLGGLERMAPLASAQTIATGSASVAPADGLVLVEAPEPYDGVDAPESRT